MLYGRRENEMAKSMHWCGSEDMLPTNMASWHITMAEGEVAEGKSLWLHIARSTSLTLVLKLPCDRSSLEGGGKTFLTSEMGSLGLINLYAQSLLNSSLSS